MDPSFKYSESDADRDENRQIVLHKSIEKYKGRKEGGLQEGDAVLGKQRLLWSLLNDSFDSFGFDCPTVPTPEIHIGAGMARHGNVVVDTNYNWNCMRLAAGLVPADCCLPWTLRFHLHSNSVSFSLFSCYI